jgi:hypothetical protein
MFVLGPAHRVAHICSPGFERSGEKCGKRNKRSETEGRAEAGKEGRVRNTHRS